MVTQKIIFRSRELKSSLQISEAFNKHFTTDGPKLAEIIVSHPSDDPLNYLENEVNNARFTLQTVSVEYVELDTRALNKSSCADRIPVQIPKDAVHLVSKPLALIYNASLEKVSSFRFGN